MRGAPFPGAWCAPLLLAACWSVATTAAASSPPPAAAAAASDVVSVCDLTGCNCTTAHKYWLVVNCTLDNKQSLDVVEGVLPAGTMEVSVSGGLEVRVQARACWGLRNLQRVRLEGARQVLVRRHAFAGLAGPSLLVQVAACGTLHLESGAFRDMGGALSAEVARCGYVRVHAAAFGPLLAASFTDVPRLELAEQAFTMPPRDLGHHGPVTTIRFTNVMIPQLPRDVFKSSLAEVSLEGAEVRDVHGEAFSGNTIAAVRAANCSLHRVRARAFSERTQLDSLSLYGCRVHRLDTDALLAAVGNITVTHSKIDVIETGAVNATVARLVVRGSEVGWVQAGGVSVHDWNRVSVEGCTLGRLGARALDLGASVADLCEGLAFAGNAVREAEAGALAALAAAPAARLADNTFAQPCHCELGRWLAELLGAPAAAAATAEFAARNLCTVDAALARCYGLAANTTLTMRNFTDTYCGGGEVMRCLAVAAPPPPGPDQQRAAAERDHLVLGLVLGLVLFVAVAGTVVILLVHGGLWLKRHGYCARFKNFNYRAEGASTETEDIMVAADKAAAPGATALPPLTSTPADGLPEELSQELLAALRERLEDPATELAAREMIERLYDHFIVEDSCTNNNRADEEAHLYEELGGLAGAATPDAATPDAAPSRPFSFLRLIEERFNLAAADATAPPTGAASVLAAEYSEPTDAEVHVYSELPAAPGRENRQNQINEGLSLCNAMAYRPLPDKPPPTTPAAAAHPGPSTSTRF